MDSPLPSVTLHELVFVVLKRKWGILTVLSVGLIGGLGWMMLIREDGYLVGAKILVKLGREQAPPTSMMGMPPMVLGYRQQDVNSEMDILQSTVLVEQVVDYFKMDQPAKPEPVPEKLIARVRYYARKYSRGVKKWANDWMVRIGLREPINDRDAAIYLVKKGILVVPQKDSNVIVVTLTLPYRTGGSMVLNKMLDDYQKYRLEIHSDRGASQFFEERASQASVALSEAEKALQDLERAQDIQALERQKEILLQQLANVEELARAAEVASAEAHDKLRRLEQETEKTEQNFAAVGAFERETFVTGLLNQLAELERDRDRLRMTEVEVGPRIANNREQYNTIRDILLTNLRSAAEERRAVAEKHATAVIGLKTRLAALQSSQMNWTDLRRRVQVSEETYLFYRKKLDESLAQSALEERRVSNVAIVERPTDAIGPAGMRKLTLLGIIVASCLLAAVLWVTVTEYFDHRIYSAPMLERVLGVPTMAVAPRVRRPVCRGAETLMPLSELESSSRHAARV